MQKSNVDKTDERVATSEMCVLGEDGKPPQVTPTEVPKALYRPPKLMRAH